MQGQEQFQGQIQNQFQKVKRLCVALIRLKVFQKNSVHLCVKTNPTSSGDNYSTLPKGIFYPNACTLRL